MKTWSMTWFPCIDTATTMSQIESQALESLEALGVQGIALLKYIVTIPHDWLVKRIFVYIIRKRSYSCACLLGLQEDKKLNDF